MESTNDTNARPAIVRTIPETPRADAVVEINQPCPLCVATPPNNSRMLKADFDAWTPEDHDDFVFECRDCEAGSFAAEAFWASEAERRLEQMRSDDAERHYGCN